MKKSRNLSLLIFFSLFLAVAIVPFSGWANESGVGSVTKLPIPRFVSLKSDKINARVGPALRYPISWIYVRNALPVEIVDEFEAWRKVRDRDGYTSWVHSTLLSGRRSAIIDYDSATKYQNQGKDMPLIEAHKKPDAHSPVTLQIEPSALGHIKKCKNSYCYIDFKAYRGWVEKKFIWGIYPDELIE